MYKLSNEEEELELKKTNTVFSPIFRLPIYKLIPTLILFTLTMFPGIFLLWIIKSRKVSMVKLNHHEDLGFYARLAWGHNINYLCHDDAIVSLNFPFTTNLTYKLGCRLSKF